MRINWGIQTHTFASLNRSDEEKLFDVTISIDAGCEWHYNLPIPVISKINYYARTTLGSAKPWVKLPFKRMKQQCRTRNIGVKLPDKICGMQ